MLPFEKFCLFSFVSHFPVRSRISQKSALCEMYHVQWLCCCLFRNLACFLSCLVSLLRVEFLESEFAAKCTVYNDYKSDFWEILRVSLVCCRPVQGRISQKSACCKMYHTEWLSCFHLRNLACFVTFENFGCCLSCLISPLWGRISQKEKLPWFWYCLKAGGSFSFPRHFPVLG